MTTRERPSRSILTSSTRADAEAGDAAALDRTLRALYAAYEALRDDPAPPAAARSNAPLADLLRAPNWWRAAQQQLAAARAALGAVTPPATGPSNREATVPVLARAVSSVLLAAVLLRLPYDAWRPDAALLDGWLAPDAGQSALASPSGECATLVAEIGVRCWLAKRPPSSLVAMCRRTLTL